MPPPAPVVAVIGGGQLARMMAQPAIALGVPLRLLAEAEGVSAAQVIPDHVIGDYTDLDTLRKVTDGCAVVTFDHEHVPTDHLHELETAGVPCRPGPGALVHAQDKGVMRARLTELGAPCPRHAIVSSVEDVAAFGLPCVLKITRGGYDGKGVWFVRSAADCVEPLATAAERGVGLLAEELVDFRRELAAQVVRSPSGQAAAYPVVASTQRDGICREVVAPAPDLELAMRPHNTGHWSQDGAVTSQFENHLRAVLDLPLGSPAARAPWTAMVNILGGPSADVGSLYDGYPHALAHDPHLRVHLYGKELRPGRKVGHVNAYGDDLDDCLERARHAAAWFAGDLGDG